MQRHASKKLFRASLILSCAITSCTGLAPPAIDQDQDVDMAPDMVADMREPEPGDACSAPSDCGESLICAGNGARFECMARCEEPGTLCPDGEVCTALDVGGGERGAICYRGGDVSRGEACNTNLECAVGNLCFGNGSARYCLEACHVDTPECTQPGARCVRAADNQTLGYCQPALGGSCDGSADCGEASLTCSNELTQGLELLRQVFPSPACTQINCVRDQECGFTGSCVSAHSSSGIDSLCLRRCDRDSACRFQVGERCWEKQDCAERSDEEACTKWLDEARLCLPANMNFF